MTSKLSTIMLDLKENKKAITNSLNTFLEYSHKSTITIKCNVHNFNEDTRNKILYVQSYLCKSGINPLTLRFTITNLDTPAYSNKELDIIRDTIDTLKLSGTSLVFRNVSSENDNQEIFDSCLDINKIVGDAKRKNLSPYEALMYFKLIVSNNVYSLDKDNQEIAHAIYKIHSKGKIVCVGYATLLNELVRLYDDKSLHSTTQVIKGIHKNDNTPYNHMTDIVNIKDNKYDINGTYHLDTCMDSTMTGNIKDQRLNYFAIPFTDLKFDKTRSYVIPIENIKNMVFLNSDRDFINENINKKVNANFSIERQTIDLKYQEKYEKLENFQQKLLENISNNKSNMINANIDFIGLIESAMISDNNSIDFKINNSKLSILFEHFNILPSKEIIDNDNDNVLHLDNKNNKIELIDAILRDGSLYNAEIQSNHFSELLALEENIRHNVIEQSTRYILPDIYGEYSTPIDMWKTIKALQISLEAMGYSDNEVIDISSKIIDNTKYVYKNYFNYNYCKNDICKSIVKSTNQIHLYDESTLL